jgi:hypothetical protein
MGDLMEGYWVLGIGGRKNKTPHFAARRFKRALSGSVADATEVPFLLL